MVLLQRLPPSLPVEVLEQILLNLPVRNLVPIALASKHFLAPLLLGSYSFAQRHTQLKHELMSFRHWRFLPLKHQVVLLYNAMTSNTPAADLAPTWRLLTSCTIRALRIQYPDFNPFQDDELLKFVLRERRHWLLRALLEDQRLCAGNSQLVFERGQVLVRRQGSQETLVFHFECNRHLLNLLLGSSIVETLMKDDRVIVSDCFLHELYYAFVRSYCRFVDNHDSFEYAAEKLAFEGWRKIFVATLTNPSTSPALVYNIVLERVLMPRRDLAAETVNVALAHGQINPAALDNELIREACRCWKPEVVDLLLDDHRVVLGWKQRIWYRFWAAVGRLGATISKLISGLIQELLFWILRLTIRIIEQTQ